MRVIVIVSVLLVIATDCVQVRGQSSQEASEGKHKSQRQADAVADKILAETSDIPNWYGDVYPALKRKYGKPVSRALYDRWRKRYYETVVVPGLMKDGYSMDELTRQEFMKQTEKQPSN